MNTNSHPNVVSEIEASSKARNSSDQLPGGLESLRRISTRDFTEIWTGKLVTKDGRSQSVAVKYLRYPNIIVASAPFRHDKVDPKRFRDDIERWVRVRHENILPLFGYQWTDQPRLIFEWYKNGNLSTHLDRNPNADKISLLSQICNGLAHLHNLQPSIIHGDIKPTNIIINDENQPMLTDFGMAPDLQLAEFGMTIADRDQGLVGYLAPELLQEGEYTKATDMYALGSLILAIYSGYPPMYQTKYVESMMKIAKGEIAAPENHPKLVADSPLWPIMRQCWKTQPKERPTAEELKGMLLKTKGPADGPSTNVVGVVSSFFIRLLRLSKRNG